MNTIFWGVDKSENDSDLAVPVTDASRTVWRSLYQLWTPALEVGDIITVLGSAQIALAADINTEFVTQIVLTEHPPRFDQEADGVFLQPSTGENVDISRHYYSTRFSAGERLDRDFPNGALVSARVRCRSTSATGYEYAQIKAGYGRMIVEVRRGQVHAPTGI